MECKLGMSDVYEQDCSFAEYCRIVIHPQIPEDVDEDEFEIGIFDITKYTSMLNITVSKDKDECEYDFVNYYKSENAITGKVYENPTSATWNADTMKDGEGMLITEKIDVKTKYEKYHIWMYAETDSTSAVAFAVFDEEGNVYEYKLSSGNLGTLNGKPRWVKYTLDVSDIKDADGLYIRGTFQNTVEKVYIYGYND